MTYVGSDVVNNGRGTEFPSFTGSRNLQVTDLNIINSEIRDAVRSAEEQAKSILNVPTEGLTSQLESVQVRNIENLRDSTNLSLRITTRAGESAPIALPFTSLGLQVDKG
jgi:hypothetical protein